MRKFLMALGAFFIVLIVAAAVGFFFVARTGNALDAESKQYVDTTMPQIIGTWDFNVLNAALDHEELSKLGISDAQMVQYFKWFSTLGKMTKYEGSAGQASINYRNGVKTISATYEVRAIFEKGPANIGVSLYKHFDSWKIVGLRVNSDALMKQVK